MEANDYVKHFMADFKREVARELAREKCDVEIVAKITIKDVPKSQAYLVEVEADNLKQQLKNNLDIPNAKTSVKVNIKEK